MRRIIRITLKTLLWIIVSLVALLLSITLLIRIPSVQTYVVQKATRFVSGKTKTRVEIGYLGINFPQSVVLEGVFAEDLTHDTLAYIGRLEVNVDMLELFNSSLSVNNLELEDATVKLVRTLPDSTFNFQFLIDAFASADTTTKADADTAKSNFRISAEDLKITNTRFLFADSVSGISFRTYAGLLDVSMDEISLDTMLFYADELLAEDVHAVFTVFKQAQAVEPPDTAVSLLPYVRANAIRLARSSFIFHSRPDTSDFGFSVGEVEVEPESIDLNAMKVDLKSFTVKSPVARISMRQPGSEPAAAEPVTTDTATGWQVRAKQVVLSEGIFKMDVTNAPRARSGIDYSHLYGTSIHVDLRDAFYSSKLIKGFLKHASLNEQCGLQLKKLTTRFAYDDRHAELAALRVETPHTFIGNYAGITYPSLASLGNAPGEMGLKISLSKTKIHLQDVLYFAPDLINMPPFNGSGNKEITVNGKLSGLLKNLDIGQLIVTAGEQTAIGIKGHINGLPDAGKARFDLHIQTFTTTENDLNSLVGKQYLPQQVRIPRQMMLTGTYKGGIKQFAADIKLESTQGHVDVKAMLDMAATETFDADVAVNSLDLGYLLKNPTLGKTSLTLKAKGRSFDQEKMVASVRANVRSVYLSGYTYQDIMLDAAADKGAATAKLAINDKNVVLKLDATANLAKNKEQAEVLLDLTGANLQALKLSRDDLRTGAQLRASVQGFDLQTMDAYLGIGNLVVASPQYRYKFDSIVVTMQNDPGKHLIDLRSSVATAHYEGSIGPDKIGGTMQQHITYYLETGRQFPDTASGNFEFTASLKPHPVYSDLLLPELTRFSGINVTSGYNSSSRELQVKATATNIVYAGNDIKDLNIEVSSNTGQLSYNLGAGSVSMTSVRLPQTTVSGTIKDGVIDNRIKVVEKDSGDRLLIRNEIKLAGAQTLVKVMDGRMTLDNEVWTVPENNLVTLAPGGVNIQNLVLAHSGSSISVQSVGAAPGAPIDVKFTKFNLGELSQIIENDTPLVRGDLNGLFHVQKTSPFEFTSDLAITDLTYQNIAIGNIKIDADNLTANRYTAKLTLGGNGNDAVVSGYFENENLNLTVDLNRINMKTVEAFVPSQLKESNGYLSGRISVKGNASKPDINGSLTFNEAQAILVMINNRISMRNETITVNNTGIHFSRFTVMDQSNQPLILDGDVLTTDFTNMKFNLDIRTQNFTVLNTTARNNKEYYGKVIVNSNIKVRGTQNLPVIDANLRMIEGSSFTFVVQEGELSTDIGKDIVQVIDKDTNLFFKFVDTLATAGSSFRGIELNANIQVDHRTVFTVIVDPVSGDKLVVAGDAILNFGLDQSGKMSLTGTYMLTEGSYRASFQKVVKREFFIRRGSSITWTGDPMDANVDITAIYRTKASATDLLAAELQGMGDNERNAYRKPLDYEVNLIIKGELLKPELSFRIDLEDKDKNAFGGMVDAKLSSVNNDPNELNKQVFALLILNKFLPPSNVNTASSGGGTSSIARNSVNQVLSDQLNALSGRYIKGAEVNVNIQSNDDYTAEGTTENTQVDVGVKREFNDRLSVQLGGSVNVNDNSPQATNQQNITGDVVVEYKITKDGRFRFKAFRENNYEGLIDGMLYKTGGGIIFSKDYDKLSELFNPVKKEEDEEVKPKEDKPENDQKK